jgi:hypothetical protein
MIRFQREARVARGKEQEAVAWAKQISDFLNQKFPEAQVQTFTSRFGSMGRVYWMADLPDLAALDAYQQQIAEDEEYWKLIAKSNDLFIEGSIEDTVVATA